MKRLIRIARIDGVDVYFHWSTLVVGGLILLASLPRLAVTAVALAAYLSVLMIHEWGHVVAARRRRCTAWSIEIYPMLALTRLSVPASYFDACVIAWGGVLAQLVVALPVVTWVALFGYSASDQTNAMLALLGFFSAFIAILNLLPAPGLDGAKAWALVPMLVGRAIRSVASRRTRVARPHRRAKWVR